MQAVFSLPSDIRFVGFTFRGHALLNKFYEQELRQPTMGHEYFFLKMVLALIF